MLKDIWNIAFFLGHLALVFVLFSSFGVPGTFLAIAIISAFWFIKGKLAPSVDLWPDPKPDDTDWPKPMKKASNVAGAGIGWLLIIGMGLGILGSIGTCAPDTGDSYYEPSRM